MPRSLSIVKNVVIKPSSCGPWSAYPRVRRQPEEDDDGAARARSAVGSGDDRLVAAGRDHNAERDGEPATRLTIGTGDIERGHPLDKAVEVDELQAREDAGLESHLRRFPQGPQGLGQGPE